MRVEAGQRVLGRYIVAEHLRSGGMAEVYRARHDRLGFVVALKVLDREGATDVIARFEEEARLMARVSHPNVVAIHDYGPLESGEPAIVMELIEGQPLDEHLETRGGAMTWRTAVRWMLEVLAGLEAMHEAGVLHRDLKPANLVLEGAKADHLKIIDFGIAKSTSGDAAKLTRAGSIIGTPGYMSPEQLFGYDLDGRADIYAAGAILRFMVTGEDPTCGDDLSEVARQIGRTQPRPRAPDSLPSIPPDIQDAIMRTLETDRGARPQTVRELIEELGRASGLEIPRRPKEVSPPERANRARVPDVTRSATPPPSGTRAMKQPPPPPGGFGVEELARILPGASADMRYLVVARLPESRLRRTEDQRWLSELPAATGRGYTVGRRFWFAWQSADASPDAAAELARDLASHVSDRYGVTARVLWRLVDAEFALTPAALMGAVALPGPLRALIDQLNEDHGDPHIDPHPERAHA